MLSSFQNCSKVNFGTVATVQSSVVDAAAGTTGAVDPSSPSTNNGGNSTGDTGSGSGAGSATPTPAPTATPVVVAPPTPTPVPMATPVVVAPPTPTPTPTPGPIPGVGSISLVAVPAVVPKGSNTQIQVTSSNFTTASYQCFDSSGNSLIKGTMDLTTSSSLPIPIDQDTNCRFTGSNPTDHEIESVTAQVSVSVDCGSQVKDAGGKCEDFACKSVVALTASQLTSIPARTSAGICYSYKLMSAIANSSSNLTTGFDSTILAKNHGRTKDNNLNDAPFLMGQFKGNFQLQGARAVKLAGGNSATASILVDNFIMTGVYPAATATPIDVRKYYRVTGTTDAAIINADGSSTGSVQFNSEQLPVVGYASGGTSSIAPLDITSSATPNVMQTLDIRALDCGGSRELSDIYLLFQ